MGILRPGQERLRKWVPVPASKLDNQHRPEAAVLPRGEGDYGILKEQGIVRLMNDLSGPIKVRAMRVLIAAKLSSNFENFWMEAV